MIETSSNETVRRAFDEAHRARSRVFAAGVRRLFGLRPR